MILYTRYFISKSWAP